MCLQINRRAARGFAAGAVLSLGVTLFGVMVSVLAIDGPTYFATQNQLQTATDAAALAGAQALPVGGTEAEAAALELGMANPVAGQFLSATNLTFDYDVDTFEVAAELKVPTLIARWLCGSGGSAELEEAPEGEQGVEAGATNCNWMTVKAHSKALPVARDTILVVDTSSSMNDLGNNQPFADVKTAARAYVDEIVSMDTRSADRIGVVSFDATGAEEIQLTGQSNSPGFASVKSAITNMSLYSGSGWNTNFHAGLKAALDEMQSRGRANASKTVIFMTDGFPNLPGGSTNINTCVNHYNNGNYYYRYRYYSYANYYWNLAKTCATNYTNHMTNQTRAQVDRAKAMGVTVHVIQIGGDDSSSLDTLRTLLQDYDWDPELQEYIADTTDGEMFAAANYDSEAILDIYKQVALDVRMRLAS